MFITPHSTNKPLRHSITYAHADLQFLKRSFSADLHILNLLISADSLFLKFRGGTKKAAAVRHDLFV